MVHMGQLEGLGFRQSQARHGPGNFPVMMCRVSCRPMINKPPPLRGLNIGIPTIIPIKGTEFINQGSQAAFQARNTKPAGFFA